MSNIMRLPPFSKTVHVEAEIPVSQRDEFERAMIDIVAGSGCGWMSWIARLLQSRSALSCTTPGLD
jgi:hypothetical protein